MRCVRTWCSMKRTFDIIKMTHKINATFRLEKTTTNSLALIRLKISCETVAVPPPTDSSGSSAAAASAIRSLVLLLLLATCLLVSVEALWVGANDDTVGATRSVGWGDKGLNANDGVAARTKARAAAEIPADLMAFLGSGGNEGKWREARVCDGQTKRNTYTYTYGTRITAAVRMAE